MLAAIEVEDELTSQGSRPWSEATFGGATSFEVQLPDQGLEEPPEMPAPQPWPEVPTPPSPMLAPEEEEPDDLQHGTVKKRKKRIRLKKRIPEAVATSETVLETKEFQEQQLDLRSILQSQVEEIEAAKHRLEVACRQELERLQHALEGAVRFPVTALDPMDRLVASDCAVSADFSTLDEEAPLALDAKFCAGSPTVIASATWSPIQVVISPRSHEKDAGTPLPKATMPTVTTKDQEWPQRLLASGLYAIFAQWITLLSMVVIWLDTEFAAMPMELEESQPAWLITVRVLNWICTVCFTAEFALRMRAMTTCKEMWNGNRFWNIYDVLIVLLAWADEIYIVATSSTLQFLRIARVLRVWRLFRFCHHLEGWGTALVDSLHALFWSTVVMALVLFTASICVTSSCADWVKSQIDSANPGWANLLDQKDPSGLNDQKHAELVINVWAWFGSLPRCSYTLLRCWGGWGAESLALLQVGFTAAATFQLYFLTVFVVVFNVAIGLVVDAILDSAVRDDRRVISN